VMSFPPLRRRHVIVSRHKVTILGHLVCVTAKLLQQEAKCPLQSLCTVHANCTSAQKNIHATPVRYATLAPILHWCRRCSHFQRSLRDAPDRAETTDTEALAVGQPEAQLMRHTEAAIVEGRETLIGRDPRTMTERELNQLGHTKRPLLKAIRENCVDCVGGSEAEVRRCRMSQCLSGHTGWAPTPFALQPPKKVGLQPLSGLAATRVARHLLEPLQRLRRKAWSAGNGMSDMTGRLERPSLMAFRRAWR
jgi:hypothetical protein